MNINQIVKDAVIGKLITALIDAGFRLELSDQDGGGLFLYAMTGQRKPKDGFKYWVRLGDGSPSGVIADYTTNLEATIKPVIDFAAQFDD